MATTADLLNVPAEFEFEGGTYRLAPPSLVQQGKFQRWLEQQAWEALDRSAGYRDPVAVAADRQQLTQDIAAGRYAWDGPAGAAAQQTPDGAAKLFSILLDVPAETAKRMVTVHLERLVPLLQAMADDDPKAMRAALAALGLPADFIPPRSERRKKAGSSRSSTRRSTKARKKSAN